MHINIAMNHVQDVELGFSGFIRDLGENLALAPRADHGVECSRRQIEAGTLFGIRSGQPLAIVAKDFLCCFE
jgi:hypothetical protein